MDSCRTVNASGKMLTTGNENFAFYADVTRHVCWMEVENDLRRAIFGTFLYVKVMEEKTNGKRAFAEEHRTAKQLKPTPLGRASLMRDR